jgi:hypothetical protein
MDNPLECYLNDHLAGSCGAISMIEELACRQEDETGKHFFEGLKSSVEKDQELLRELLKKAGMEESKTMQVAGGITARAGKLKLMWEGLDPGELGMFEALEMLALGIQGKRILWVMLGDIAPLYPEWSGVDFNDLELQAIRQRDAVEVRRLDAGRHALPAAERRTKILLSSPS